MDGIPVFYLVAAMASDIPAVIIHVRAGMSYAGCHPDTRFFLLCTDNKKAQVVAQSYTASSQPLKTMETSQFGI